MAILSVFFFLFSTIVQGGFIIKKSNGICGLQSQDTFNKGFAWYEGRVNGELQTDNQIDRRTDRQTRR